jgi:septal ring-binding cell division protein DamX
MSDEQRIRELAYQIWEAEGCPDGEQDRHWSLASRLASEAVRAETPTPPARVSRSRPRAAAEVDTPAATSRRGGNGRQRNEQPH